jgi:hypothetical protein
MLRRFAYAPQASLKKPKSWRPWFFALPGILFICYYYCC